MQSKMGHLFSRQLSIRLGILLCVAAINGVQANLAVSQSLPPQLNQPTAPVQPNLGREILPLKLQIQALMSQYQFLTAGVSLVELDTGNYVNLDGEKVFPAASTIKLPILIAFFEAVDKGEISLNEILTVDRSNITSGSGNLQYSKGKQITALEAATKMIIISDNTATNMIVDRLGGLKYLNQRFQSWGLRDTVMQNRLGDFKGTNKTTAADLVRACTLIAKQQIISANSRTQALDILNATENRKLLVAGLGEGAHIAHKTGDIGFLIGDAGIIEKPDGKLYLLAVFVRRPHNDLRARKFVQELSRLTYNYFTPSPVATSQ
jgi:beta-lactamase class A